MAKNQTGMAACSAQFTKWIATESTFIGIGWNCPRLQGCSRLCEYCFQYSSICIPKQFKARNGYICSRLGIPTAEPCREGSCDADDDYVERFRSCHVGSD